MPKPTAAAWQRYLDSDVRDFCMKKKLGIATGIVLIVAASVVAHLYVQSQVYYPVVKLDLPGDLRITALLPETKERKACGVANDRFLAPFKQSCKDCKISIARCERE